MLYNNICMNPPTSPRPATASLTPKETAAPLLLDGFELEPVPVMVPLGLRVVGSLVVEHCSFPWTTLPLNLLKPLQSIWAVLSMFKAPTTLLISGKLGVVKFPVRSTAPPTVVKTGKLMV